MLFLVKIRLSEIMYIILPVFLVLYVGIAHLLLGGTCLNYKVKALRKDLVFPLKITFVGLVSDLRPSFADDRKIKCFSFWVRSD